MRSVCLSATLVLWSLSWNVPIPTWIMGHLSSIITSFCYKWWGPQRLEFSLGCMNNLPIPAIGFPHHFLHNLSTCKFPPTSQLSPFTWQQPTRKGIRASDCSLGDQWNQPGTAFQTAAYAALQGSGTLREKCSSAYMTSQAPYRLVLLWLIPREYRQFCYHGSLPRLALEWSQIHNLPIIGVDRLFRKSSPVVNSLNRLYRIR